MRTRTSLGKIQTLAGKRATKRRLAALIESEAEARRETGVLAVEMYREGRFSADELAASASRINEIAREVDELSKQLGLEPDTDLGERPEPSPETAEFLAVRSDETSEFPTVDPEPTPAEAVDPDSTPEPPSEDPDPTPEPPTEDPEPKPEPQPSEAEVPVSPSAIDELISELDRAEREHALRASGPVTIGPDPDDGKHDPLEELEALLESERKAATATIAELEGRLKRAEEKAAAAEARAAAAESNQSEEAAHARTAAAAWLKREAEAIRAEAAGASPSPDAEAALAKAERSHREEIARLKEQLERLRTEKSEEIEAAERRLAEIEAQAEEAGRRVDAAERRYAEEAAEKIAAAEARADAAEAEARQAAASWLRSQAAQLKGVAGAGEDAVEKADDGEASS